MRYLSKINYSLTPMREKIQSNAGYSLYLVCIVLLVGGVLFTISLQISGVAQVLSVRHIQYVQARLLAHSGIARTEFFLNGGDGHDLNWQTDSLVEKISDNGTITISCKPFGLLTKIVSTGEHLKKSFTINTIMGRDLPQSLYPLITLSGHVGGLVLANGSSITNGTVVLHHGALYRGSNRTPIPNTQFWVKLQESPPLPFPIDKVKSFFQIAEETLQKSYSSAPPDSSEPKADTSVIWGNYEIRDRTIEDSIIVVKGNLTISDRALCRKSILLAEKIVIDNGTTDRCVLFSQKTINIRKGEHDSQFFANDSILIASSAHFNKMSLWVCRRRQLSDTSQTGGIFFNPQGTYIGHALCFSDSLKHKKKIFTGPSIHLGESSNFSGSIITDGDILIKNVTLKASLWARSTIAVEKDIVYKNWLFNCKLKPLDHAVAFPLIGEIPAKVSMVH